MPVSALGQAPRRHAVRPVLPPRAQKRKQRRVDGRREGHRRCCWWRLLLLLLRVVLQLELDARAGPHVLPPVAVQRLQLAWVVETNVGRK